MDGPAVGRLLVLVGGALLLFGLLLSLGLRIPLIGRMPGDFSCGGPGWRVYVSLGTSLLLSLLLTLVFWLFSRR